MLPDWYSNLGEVGIPLLLCSIIAGALCFERAWHFVRLYLKRSSKLAELQEVLDSHCKHSKEIRDEVLTLLLQDIRRVGQRGISALRLIASLSPLLGLLGTVLGIIKAFQAIASHTGPISPSLVANGLWEAMLTTACGLAISLPCLLAAWTFQLLIDSYLNDLKGSLNWASIKMVRVEDENPGHLTRLAA